MFHDIDIPHDTAGDESLTLSETPFLHEGARVVKSRIGSWPNPRITTSHSGVYVRSGNRTSRSN